jgi:uncharacterized protein (DUF433 family)
MQLAGHPRISADPAVCGGRPTVTGTRVRVTDVLEMLAGGATEAEIVRDIPYLTVEGIAPAWLMPPKPAIIRSSLPLLNEVSHRRAVGADQRQAGLLSNNMLLSDSDSLFCRSLAGTALRSRPGSPAPRRLDP